MDSFTRQTQADLGVSFESSLFGDNPLKTGILS